jgi:hypothetical protein
MLRVDEQDLAVISERACLVRQVFLKRLSKTKLEIDELLFTQVKLDPSVKNLHVRLPSAKSLVEDVERRERLWIARLIVEHLRIRANGFVDIVYLVFVKSCDLVIDRFFLVGCGRKISLLLVNAEKFDKTRRLPVQALQCAEGFRILAIGFINRAVDLAPVAGAA